MSDNESEYLFGSSTITERIIINEIATLLETTVRTALETQKRDFDRQLNELKTSFLNTRNDGSEIEIFEEVKQVNGVNCDEPLDMVKSLPEFDGRHEYYVSWRQAAHEVYRLFENFSDSSKHYQAVAIVRNKIRGPADAVLASFNKVLNFCAIIAR